VRFDPVYVTVNLPHFLLHNCDSGIDLKIAVQNQHQDNQRWVPEYPSVAAASVLGYSGFQGDDKL
jgi:hypothetical protein